MANTVKKKLDKFLDPNKHSIFINKENVIVFEEMTYGDTRQVKPVGSAAIEDIIEAFKTPPSGNYECLLLNRRVLGVNTVRKTDLVQHSILLQFEPQIRQLKFVDEEAGHYDGDNNFIPDEVKKYNLYIPWNQFIIVINEYSGEFSIANDSKVFITKKPVSGIQDTLYRLPINNIDNTAIICWGNNPLLYTKGESLTLYAERAAQFFWSSLFNEHWEIYRTQAITPLTADYKTWQNSKPESIMNEPFAPSGYKVSNWFECEGKINVKSSDKT